MIQPKNQSIWIVFFLKLKFCEFNYTLLIMILQNSNYFDFVSLVTMNKQKRRATKVKQNKDYLYLELVED